MSEEIRNPGMEVSDAELADVSGAYDEKTIDARAKSVCSSCCYSGGHCGGTRFDSMVAYLRKNGADSVKEFRECPYYTL